MRLIEEYVLNLQSHFSFFTEIRYDLLSLINQFSCCVFLIEELIILSAHYVDRGQHFVYTYRLASITCGSRYLDDLLNQCVIGRWAPRKTRLIRCRTG